MRPIKKTKLKSGISLVDIYKYATKVTSNTRTRKKNYLPKKLLSRVTDNCMNISSCLVRKYAGIFSRRHYQTFSACILIFIASLNCARKSRSSFKMQERRHINFYNNISEKYNSARNIPKSFPFRLFSITAFINSRIQI